MGDEPKKISFSFNKKVKSTSKSFNSTKNVQLIEALENQRIKPKVKGLQREEILAIPMRQPIGSKSEVKEAGVLLTEDQVAARELIKDAQSKNTSKQSEKRLGAISTKANIANDIEESTIENYEAVPIEKFGLALLTGMNWKDGGVIGKSKLKKKVELKEPPLRVNRMALGADKSLYKQRNDVNELIEKEPKLKIGSYAKIINGKHKGNYCRVQGFDDDPERVTVKLSLNEIILSIIKYHVEAVTKDEYLKCCRVLNNTKYEKYIRSRENKM